MPNGSRTPDDVRMRFATEFARTGNISESARIVKLPRETARDIARELESDPAFAEARRSLLTHALERAEVMATQLLELTASRAKKQPRDLPMGEGGITIHDKSPDYVRAFTDLYRATQQHAKLKLDSDPNKQSGPIEIVFKRAEVKAPDSDASD
jgi:hypothetical protein